MTAPVPHLREWSDEMQNQILRSMSDGMDYCDAVSSAIKTLARKRDWADPAPTRFGKAMRRQREYEDDGEQEKE